MPNDTPLPPAADPVEALAAHPAAGRPKSLAAAVEALLLTARAAAQLCGVSVATWHRWNAAGRCPAPVRIGATVRWRRDDVTSWTAAPRGPDGQLPDRRTWELLRDGPAQRDGRPR
jgi:predicted DNA-binding transcriptional regulator AlpA